ncbi:MFS transporter [Ruminococcaceae bacterium OttesenSCG-928-A16]|nr:MFS transporter [Ruminococcaceae bacterium OttesenSCG-928-A16]
MKLNYKRTFLVGLGFMAICAFWQMYDHLIPLILKYSFGIEDGVSGWVMAADNVLALFMLPLFGALSDRTHTRLGRRMPFIVVGSMGAALAMMLIPISSQIRSLPLFVVGLGLALFFMATYRSPAVALMPDVTVKPLRSKANAVINLMGSVGGMMILGLTPILLPKVQNSQAEYLPNYVPLFLACMVIMLGSTVILLLFVKEPKLVEQMQADAKAWGIADEPEQVNEKGQLVSLPMEAPVKRSMGFLLASVALWFMGYNAVTTAFSKYCVERFGLGAGDSAMVLMIATAAATISYIPVGNLATKIGRKKCIMGGVVLLAVAFGLGSTFSTFSPLLYVLFVAAGIAWAAINVNSYPMVVEMARGANVGKFTGYYYTASMSAQILTPILSGYLLQYAGYAWLFPYGALFVGLAFVTMLMVRHGDAKPLPPASKLEAFDAMD